MASDAKINIVDNNLDHQELMSEMDSREGYEPLTFNLRVEFLETHALSQTGFIIFDNQMPGMTGLNVQQEMKNRGVTLPVFFSGDSLIPKAGG